MNLGHAQRRDPLLALVRQESEGRRWLAGALALAAAIHVAIAWELPRLLRRSAKDIAPVTEIVDIDIPAPPPPPPEPPKPDVPQEEKLPAPLPTPSPAAAAAAPAPAQAAAVLTQAPDPNEPVDLTGGFVTGTAETYAGGSTSSAGTSTRAVRTVAVASGAPNATGTAPVAAPTRPDTPDRSRRPSLGGDSSWQCPFPSEADAAQVDHAVVSIRVEVDSSGTARNVTVTRDPGNGFAREARRCALTKKWSPALDHDGNAIAGSAVVNVKFDR